MGGHQDAEQRRPANGGAEGCGGGFQRGRAQTHVNLEALRSRREPDERTVSPAYGKRAAGIIALTYRSMNPFRWMSNEVDARVGFEVVTYPSERRFVV